LLIYAQVLFDTGSTSSFVFPYFAIRFDKQPIMLERLLFYVSTYSFRGSYGCGVCVFFLLCYGRW